MARQMQYPFRGSNRGDSTRLLTEIEVSSTLTPGAQRGMVRLVRVWPWLCSALARPGAASASQGTAGLAAARHCRVLTHSEVV